MSNGGKVALEFALEHPGMVAALVLVGPTLGGHHPSEEKRRRLSEILSVARDRGFEAGVEAWMEDPFYPPAKDKPTVEGLSRIVTPTLILVGERDNRDNREIASILAGRLPRAEKKLFSCCGYLVNRERPQEFYGVVADFLDALGHPSEG